MKKYLHISQNKLYILFIWTVELLPKSTLEIYIHYRIQEQWFSGCWCYILEMSSYMAGVFDLDLDVDTVTVGDSDEDDIIEVDEVFLSYVVKLETPHYYLT